MARMCLYFMGACLLSTDKNSLWNSGNLALFRIIYAKSLSSSIQNNCIIGLIVSVLNNRLLFFTKPF